MKPTLGAGILVACLASFSRSTPPAPDGKALLREVQAKYGSLRTYSDTGEERESGSDHFTNFTIMLARPEMYRITWGDEQSMWPSKGAVWFDGESRFVEDAAGKSQPKDTETAFAMVAGIMGAASLTANIFFSTKYNLITRLEEPTIKGEVKFDGEDCYVLTARDRKIITWTLWISKADKLIRQERSESQTSGTPPPPISYEDAKQSLKSMGKDDSDAAVRKQLAINAEARQSVAEAGPHTYINIEVHRQIKINEPLRPSDFRDKH